MLVKVVLNVSGLEKLALDQQLESWDMSAIPEGAYSQPTSKSVVLAEIEAALPAAEQGVATVLEHFADQERELRSKLNEELAELSSRKSKLLAISMSPRASALF